jgi:hypothetical protein
MRMDRGLVVDSIGYLAFDPFILDKTIVGCPVRS